jgi:glutamate carboxypeptidase
MAMTGATILERLRQLVEVESPSGHVEGLARLGGMMAAWLEEAGWRTTTQETNAGPLVTARRPGGPLRFLVLSHLDTVWPLGTAADMPFRVEGGAAYGPGVFDMKAGLAVMAAAADLVRDRDTAEVTALMTPDEEVGSGASRAAIVEAARRADAVLVLEPSGPGGALKVGRKGVGTFTLSVTGRAAHAGLEPERGIDAVEELCRQVLGVKALARPDRGTTINVGVVGGGTRSNVVAERAWAEIDVRVATAAEADRVGAALAALVPAQPGAQVVCRGAFDRPPMDPTPQVWEWVARVAARRRDLGLPPVEAIRVGGASDGNLTAPLAPTLDGLGPQGSGAHARHEHVIIDDLAPRAALLAALWRERP